MKCKTHSYMPADSRNSWFECPQHGVKSTPEYPFEFYITDMLRNEAKGRLFKTESDHKFFYNPILEKINDFLWQISRWRHKLTQ